MPRILSLDSTTTRIRSSRPSCAVVKRRLAETNLERGIDVLNVIVIVQRVEEIRHFLARIIA